MISAELSDAAVMALADTIDARANGTATRTRRSANRTRKAVKKALLAGLDGGRTGDPNAKRAARKAVARAKDRLDRTVAKGIVSRQTASALLRGLRSLYRAGHANSSDVELDEAIAAGLISPKDAAILLVNP